MSQSSCLLFGYARVSTQGRNSDHQLDDLTKTAYQRVFQEKVSSANARPQLQKMLDILQEGGTITVWKGVVDPLPLNQSLICRHQPYAHRSVDMCIGHRGDLPASLGWIDSPHQQEGSNRFAPLTCRQGP